MGLDIIVQKKSVSFQPFIATCCVDLPAKSAVQKSVQYNRCFSCEFCLQEGESVPIGKKKQIRYGKTSTKAEQRAHAVTREVMLKMGEPIKKRRPQLGIHGKSVLIDLPRFDIVHSFGIDYMHNTLLGVTRKLINLWTESCLPFKRRSKFRLKAPQQNLLNRRIMEIRPSKVIKRRPKSLVARKQFKANELRSMLLYYLPVCLQDILLTPYRAHFMLLSNSIYILLKKSVTEEELRKAEQNLDRFVDEFETLYGIEHITMNVHLLRHLVQSVRNTGPIWAHSAFSFDRKLERHHISIRYWKHRCHSSNSSVIYHQ